MWQFCEKWLSLAFTQPWAITSGVAATFAIVGGIIVYKRPRWAKVVNKLLWQIPLLVLVVLVVIRLVQAPYEIYLEQEQRYSQMNERVQNLEKSVSALEQEVNIVQRHRPATLGPSERFYAGQIIQLSNISQDSPVLAERIFRDCDIYGPNLVHFNKCNIVNCTIDRGDSSFLALPDMQSIPVGVVDFQACVFESCRFWDIGVIGTEQELATLRTTFKK